MSTDQNKTVVKRFNELFDQGGIAGAAQLLAPNCMAHEPGMPPLDKESFRQVGVMYMTAFANSQTLVEQIVAEGDTVFVRGTWTATHRGDFNGIPATGKQIQIAIMTADRIVNGQIVEHWGRPDTLTLLQQLGAVPSNQAE